MMKLINGSCFDHLHRLDDQSADLILIDPPYNSMGLKWDTSQNWEVLMAHFRRILTQSGTIIIFGQQPMVTDVINAGRGMFRQSLVWYKSKVAGFTNANYRHLSQHEDILVFSKGKAAPGCKNPMYYEPQGLVRESVVKIRGTSPSSLGLGRNRSSQSGEYVSKGTGYPRSVLKFANAKNTQHPCEKPVDLLQYLIRTYCPPKGVVLDCFMGSGSTGVAAVRENRDFIGIELDEHYFEVSCKRIFQVLYEPVDKMLEEVNNV